MFTGILSTYMVHTDAIKKEFPVTHEAGKNVLSKKLWKMCLCEICILIIDDYLIMFDYPNCNRLRE